MKILVTGAKGFIGRNLTAELKSKGYGELYEYDLDTDPALLDEYTRDCGFVFHLAGVNRPEDPAEFMRGNFGFTSVLLEALRKNHNRCPVMLSSSSQAALSNPYGLSKKAGEDLLFAYGEETGARVLVYRFPNVFGKWCRPGYNSAVATFCHQISRCLPVEISDRSAVLHLTYIDDVVGELLRALEGNETRAGCYCAVPLVYTTTLGSLADLIQGFRDCRITLGVPDLSNSFEKKLFATYLSYLPTDSLSCPLKTNADERGYFAEILRTSDRGQFSVNTSKPGVTRGNHWHHTKSEKFLVTGGRGVIRLRQVGEEEITEFVVSGDRPELVEIPPGYTHSIRNTGDTDLIIFIWANETFDPERPDTYFLPV